MKIIFVLQVVKQNSPTSLHSAQGRMVGYGEEKRRTGTAGGGGGGNGAGKKKDKARMNGHPPHGHNLARWVQSAEIFNL